MEWKVRGRSITVHRLLMIAEHGVEAVKDKHVHHKSLRWDNRPETLELITPEEHQSKHGSHPHHTSDEREIHDCPRDPDLQFTDRDWLQDAMLRYGSVEKIAEICDRDTNEIQNWIEWFGIKSHKDPLEG